ncbi:carbohydrate porin [Aquirufa aurantiipilula]|uniref:Carbohydrate porin n=1 Tax=Aquirufa aurantiipilula TaxID=2696561 RepID=A0ABT6BGH2_9BACT|nr:carbohydrate porin [Aquirufa aurantiipilula]MDF5689551.1 carbohydrate porin [Aquirufa aurantiipilula]
MSLHFQQTAVYQYHAAFDALYSGENSLQNREEGAISLTSTLFLDVPLWKGASFTFNPELSGGKGLSQAKGLGGFTNGETFRIGNPEPVVYVARLLLEQNFELAHLRNLKLVIGKYGLSDYFDFNAYSHDPRAHFMNWSLMNQGSWDYAANTRGYTSGIYAAYTIPNWEARASFSAVPTSANGPDLDYQFDKANGINVELTKPFQMTSSWTGIFRVLGYRNQAAMGNYDLANMRFGMPDITSTRSPFRTKYGFGLNAELSYLDVLGVFARYGWSDGKNETWAFTEIDESISLGFHFWGKSWNRKQDFAGIAWVANGLSTSHQKYQELGGNGFMIGDGKLNYGLENILEAFYSFQVPHSPFTLSPDFQWVINPGYNIDRGPLTVWGLRIHTEL